MFYHLSVAAHLPKQERKKKRKRNNTYNCEKHEAKQQQLQTKARKNRCI